MKAKYKAHDFGSCPRTLCEKQPVRAARAALAMPRLIAPPLQVLPVGLSDSLSPGRDNSLKLFCARCQEVRARTCPV